MENPAEVAEVVHVDSLDKFVHILMHWHQSKVAQLEHFLKIPEGVQVTINDEEEVQLQGDLHKGFLIGLSIALIELGNLPFITSEDVEPAEDEPIH